jgi:hypothetical protein
VTGENDVAVRQPVGLDPHPVWYTGLMTCSARISRLYGYSAFHQVGAGFKPALCEHHVQCCSHTPNNGNPLVMFHPCGFVTRTGVGHVRLHRQRRRRDPASAVSPCRRGDGDPEPWTPGIRGSTGPHPPRFASACGLRQMLGAFHFAFCILHSCISPLAVSSLRPPDSYARARATA